MIIKAKWIKGCIDFIKKDGDYYGSPSPYFRYEFGVEKEVKRAIIYYSAVGVLKVYINGKQIDDDYMSPGFTDYRTRIPVLRKDVTELIEGNNAIGIVAGDGWAVGFMGNNMKRCSFSDTVYVMAQLEIEFADGEKRIIQTDTDWKTATGEIQRTDNYMGEFVDKRLSLGDFSSYGYDDENWNYAISSLLQINFTRISDLSQIPPIRVKHTVKPINMHKDINGNFIYDFGQNLTGVLSIKLKGERNASVTVRHGEMLEKDGRLYTDNLRLAQAKDICILSGSDTEEFRPLFTFHGFRYAEISVTGNVEIVSVEAQVMYTDLPKTGDFKCSDDLVNKLYSNIVWSQRSNFLSVPTDCPQRDERLGWTGDAQIFVGSAMFNMNCKTFYEKYMADIRDAQAGNGGVGGIAPQVPVNNWYYSERDNFSAGWGDVATVIPFEHYLMYGDKSILYKSIVSMKSFVDYCTLRSDNLIRPAEDNYGDWLNIDDDTDASAISTLYFAYSTLLTAKVCEILGDGEKQKYYDLYESIKRAFIARFVGKGGVITSDTQTVYLLAYAFGILDEDRIKNNLLRKIAEKNYHISCGFLGVKFMLPVLCEIGFTDIAYLLLTNKTYPSWCFSVLNGATTIWERWNSWTIENGFADRSMNSFNHYSLGSCSEWMFKYCLGINPSVDNPGFKKLIIRPFVDFSGKLNKAEGYYDTSFGRISVQWERDNDGVIYKVVYPREIEAEYDFSHYVIAEKIGKGEFHLKGYKKA